MYYIARFHGMEATFEACIQMSDTWAWKVNQFNGSMNTDSGTSCVILTRDDRVLKAIQASLKP